MIFDVAPLSGTNLWVLESGVKTRSQGALTGVCAGRGRDGRQRETVAETAARREHFFKSGSRVLKPGPFGAVPETGDTRKQWKNIWSTGGFGLSPLSGTATH